MVRETFAELLVAFPQDSKSPYLFKLLCHKLNYFLLSYIPKTEKCQANKKQAIGNGTTSSVNWHCFNVQLSHNTDDVQASPGLSFL